jgi:hypothetical protein
VADQGQRHPAPYGYPPPVARPPVPPRAVGLPRPVAVQAVAGTPFGLAMVDVAPTVSGPAVASLVAGIASTLVSFVVLCFGAVGAEGGWGPMVAGAFAVLAGVLGGAGLGLGTVGLRRIKRASGPRATGRGLAIGGVVCGSVGLGLTAVAMLLAFSLAA